MISEKRFIEIISGAVAWGQDHEKEFYDCLMNALDMTDEELAEMGFVYTYDGEVDENLVKLQEELEKNKVRKETDNMNYKEENISVKNYLLKKTSVGDYVDIYDCGYYCCSFEIDSEDLFARYLSSDISYQYIDDVKQFDRVIQDTDSEGKMRQHKCKYHLIHIGWTKTDTTKYRMKMTTESGVLYTRWYSDKDGDDTYDQMIKESDDVLENYKSWSREVEYARIERR